MFSAVRYQDAITPELLVALVLIHFHGNDVVAVKPQFVATIGSVKILHYNKDLAVKHERIIKKNIEETGLGNSKKIAALSKVARLSRGIIMRF